MAEREARLVDLSSEEFDTLMIGLQQVRAALESDADLLRAFVHAPGVRDFLMDRVTQSLSILEAAKVSRG